MLFSKYILCLFIYLYIYIYIYYASSTNFLFIVHILQTCSDGNVLDTTESFELNEFQERFHIHDSKEKDE